MFLHALSPLPANLDFVFQSFGVAIDSCAMRFPVVFCFCCENFSSLIIMMFGKCSWVTEGGGHGTCLMDGFTIREKLYE
jgi:hypothetical protein